VGCPRARLAGWAVEKCGPCISFRFCLVPHPLQYPAGASSRGPRPGGAARGTGAPEAAGPPDHSR
jgi:hypothetical protein